MAEPKGKRVLGAGRVAFLALREVITAELAEGWPMAEVHRRHQDRLGIEIAQFRSYVARYVSADQLWTARRKVPPAAAIPPSSPTPRPPAEPPRLVTRSVNLKREDLI